MKKYFTLFVLLFASATFSSCNHQDPVEYNNKIILMQRNSVISIDKLKKAIDNFSAANEEQSFKEINTAYDSAYIYINNSLDVLSKMGAYRKDDTLRLAAIELFNSYNEAIQNNYKKMVELYKIPVNQYSDQDRANFQQLEIDANRKLDFAFKKFLPIQKRFAKNYNLEIE